jgi:hypothetical protein
METKTIFIFARFRSCNTSYSVQYETIKTLTPIAKSSNWREF